MTESLVLSQSLSVVAVGGGSPLGSQALLEHAVELAGVEHGTRVLIVPTPSTSEDKYSRRVAGALRLYQETLGLPTDVLHGFDVMPSESEIREKLDSADLVYITGGDTSHTMREWAKYGIDGLLKTRALGGLVLSGTSTGSIVSFAWGHCDPFPDRKANAGEYVAVNALGLVSAGVTPHFNRRQPDGGLRGDDFLGAAPLENSQRKLRYAFGIDNKASVVVHNGLISWRGFEGGRVTLIEAPDGQTQTRHAKMETDESMRLDEL